MLLVVTYIRMAYQQLSYCLLMVDRLVERDDYRIYSVTESRRSNSGVTGSSHGRKSLLPIICSLMYMIKNIVFMALILIAAQTTGCFDGNSDSSSSSAEKTQSAAGIYLSVNSFFVSEAILPNTQQPVDVIIASTGEARFLFLSASGTPLISPQLAGNVDVSGNKLTATLLSYSDGNLQPSIAELTGEVITQDNILGNFTWGLEFGRYVLNYSPLYEETSSLDKLEGIWTFNQASSGGAIYTLTLTINADGSIFGSDTAGCIYNGSVTIIDSRYNVYRMSLAVSSCNEFDDIYNGLASFSETAFLGRSLMFGVTSLDHSLSGIVMSPTQP